MRQENPQTSLREIRYLLSHLHGEVTNLEESYSRILLVLKSFEGAGQFQNPTQLLPPGIFFRKWEALIEECRRVDAKYGVALIDFDTVQSAGGAPACKTGDEAIERISMLLKRYQDPSFA